CLRGSARPMKLDAVRAPAVAVYRDWCCDRRQCADNADHRRTCAADIEEDAVGSRDAGRVAPVDMRVVVRSCDRVRERTYAVANSNRVAAAVDYDDDTDAMRGTGPG